LREAILQEGFNDFEEAVKSIKFGQSEEFLVKLLLIENLEKKVRLEVKILKFIDQSNELIFVRYFLNIF
jgi:hypothetical protein